MHEEEAVVAVVAVAVDEVAVAVAVVVVDLRFAVPFIQLLTSV